MVDEQTNDVEVEGSLAHLIHVDDSGEDPVRTLLALTAREELNLTTDENDESFEPAHERRTRRYRLHNTADLEVGSAIDADLEAFELVGLVDSDGAMTFDTESRRLRPEDDEYIELAYGTAEGFAFGDAELVHRFEDVELVNPEVDMGSVPPLVSWTWWIHGAIQFAFNEPE